ncbi:tetratricopeptide repeat protein [Desulfovermiculus halophilus]|uniref:tetratricopeptide repeat protein n=1 Tax=Desulfovermiculus halophilus TaxID=339722 RepID=UPI000487A2A2|nr:tetratricopeptide repeat protein [Desulfovermiculus halophilus]
MASTELPGRLSRRLPPDCRFGCLFSLHTAGLCLLILCLLLSGCALIHPDPEVDKEIQARMDLASSYLSSDRPRLALRQLKAVQDRGQTSPEYHLLYGLISARLDRHQESREHLIQAVRLRPDFARAWNNLGKVQASMGLEEDAEESFQRALDIPTYLTPEYPAYNLARLYAQQGKSRQAEDMAGRSLQANPGFAPAVVFLGQLLTEENRIQDAVQVLRQGLKARPGQVRIMQALAENLLRLGEQAQARVWFERIADTAPPQSEPAQVARDYLELLPN